MSVLQRPGFVAWALIAAAALAASVWFFTGDEPAQGERSAEAPPPASPSETALPFGAGAAVVGPNQTSAELANEAVVAATTLSAAHQAQLRALLQADARRETEYARLVEAIAYSLAFNGLREAMQQNRGREVIAAFARQVDAGIDTRLARGEIDLPRATIAKVIVFDAIEPDPEMRDRRVNQWQQQHERDVPPDPMTQTYLSGELELLTEWALAPATEGQVAVLRDKLSTLRREAAAGPR